jgi:hypothetical protein
MVKQDFNERILDLGCGPNKVKGAPLPEVPKDRYTIIPND